MLPDAVAQVPVGNNPPEGLSSGNATATIFVIEIQRRTRDEAVEVYGRSSSLKGCHR